MVKTKLLVQVLKKIPVFQSLPPSLVRKLVTLCQMRDMQEGEVLCRHDTPSDEMYVLLAGELAVSTAEGLRVATIRPVTSVGEMGVITGQPRSATVAAVEASRILALRREHFEGIFDDDPGQRARVLGNFIQILADRVTDDNLRMRDYESELQRYKGTARGLESRIHQDEARIEALADIMESQGAMSRQKARAAIEAVAVDHAPTVLIVDDEADFRRLVRESLDHVSVVEAANGAQALSTLETLDADLVITDIRMPGVDGLELIDRILALYPGLPVVCVSGHVGMSDIDNRGFSGFVGKPLRVADFRQLVDRTLAGA
jgi:CheY-like chemotaxis protein